MNILNRLFIEKFYCSNLFVVIRCITMVQKPQQVLLILPRFITYNYRCITQRFTDVLTDISMSIALKIALNARHN